MRYGISFKNSLEDQFKWAKEGLDIAKKKVIECNDFVELLSNCIQPTNEEIYSNITEYFKVQCTNGSYEQILGGDGRSSAWSEQRNGKIIKVTIHDYIYLNENQIDIIRGYIKNTYVYDNLTIVSSGYKH